MKPPTAGRPSGDRTIARGLVAALERAGFEVELASRLRTWTNAPDIGRLKDFQVAAERERERLMAAWDEAGSGHRPDLWFTYHNHYKAPDLLGPGAAAVLGVPYVIVEASYAARRATGAWTDWLEAAKAGIVAADLIFSFTARDEAGLEPIVARERLRRLAPFIVAPPAPATRAKPARSRGPVRLVTVAMMREGAKEKSYRLLASALERLSQANWRLDVVGDGALAPQLQQQLIAAGGDRVRFLGRLEGGALAQVLGEGEVFVWPGIEEAFGMAYLEAQAHGLPVAACDTAGVGEVVRDGVGGLLAEATTPEALADVLDRLIASPELREALGQGARRQILTHHSIEAAADTLGAALRGLRRAR